jgi:hypothetical protein
VGGSAVRSSRGSLPRRRLTAGRIRRARPSLGASGAPARAGDLAWRIADELGWAKTYDAEYLALAGVLGCRLVTLDLRLRRGAERLGYVVTPMEL